MTEYELFEQAAPCIAEMIQLAREVSDETYNAWKGECLSMTPPGPFLEFIKKVFLIVDMGSGRV